jgi:hypothetical protein
MERAFGPAIHYHKFIWRPFAFQQISAAGSLKQTESGSPKITSPFSTAAARRKIIPEHGLTSTCAYGDCVGSIWITA